MNLLLSGQAHLSLSPWIGGAPLAALRKGDNGVHRRLASSLCCAAVRPELPELFLPYSYVGMGIRAA